MRKAAVLLRMVAPLQSWGVDAVFHERTTLDFPTRSGVLGLCLAGMGKSGEQRELLERLSELEMTAVSFVKTRADGTPIPPRIYRDFQIVGGGYSPDNPEEALNIPTTEDGKKPGAGGVLIRHKDYILEACFFVVFEGDEELVDMIFDGVGNPECLLFLGRSKCIPVAQILAGKYDNAEEALKDAAREAEYNGRKELFRVVEREVPGILPNYLPDVPVRFGPDRDYEYRAVWKVYSELAYVTAPDPSTDFDPASA